MSGVFKLLLALVFIAALVQARSNSKKARIAAAHRRAQPQEPEPLPPVPLPVPEPPKPVEQFLEKLKFCELYQLCSARINLELDTCERRYVDTVYHNRGYYLVHLIRSLKKDQEQNHVYQLAETSKPHKVFEECSHSAIFNAVSKPWPPLALQQQKEKFSECLLREEHARFCSVGDAIDKVRREMNKLDQQSSTPARMFKNNITENCMKVIQPMIEGCQAIGKCCIKTTTCETAYRSMYDRPEPPTEGSIRFNAEQCIKNSPGYEIVPAWQRLARPPY